MTTAPAAELRAGVALLASAHQLLTGQLDEADYAAVVDSTTADTWSDNPVDAVRAVAYMGLRACSLLATATGTDVDTVLGYLGAEAAGLPD